MNDFSMSDTKLVNQPETTAAWPAELRWGSSLGRAVKAVQKYLVVQPKPDAPTTAQAALLPLLFAAGQEVWNPMVLRPDGLPTSGFARYRLRLVGGEVLLDVWAVGEQLGRPPARDRLPEGKVWGLRSNGADWQLIDFSAGTPEVLELSIFDDGFPGLVDMLFSNKDDRSLEARLAGARRLLEAKNIEAKLERLIAKLGVGEVRKRIDDRPEALADMLLEEGLLDRDEAVAFDPGRVQQAVNTSLRATELGFVRPAPPFAHISLQDVRRHAEMVKNLKGHLSVRFDDERIEVRSRSAFYYVLAALAVQYGQSGLIPAESLTRPPDEPPEDQRTKPLGRPGWYLTVPKELGALEQAVARLLDGLNLRGRFEATQRKKPYPAA